VMTGAFVFIDAVNHSTANEEERNISLVQQTSALRRMTQELSQAYQLNEPTSAGTSNVVDVDVWLASAGSSQHARRIVYNCAAASGVSGQQKCIRYELLTTDNTAVASLSTDANAKSSVLITRLLNGTGSSPVFTFVKDSREAETGKGRPSYGTITIKTPGSGERSSYANQTGYSYSTALTDSFYMRNLDLSE
jgi:hypothetical protein